VERSDTPGTRLPTKSMHPGKGARVDPIQWICHPVDPFHAEICVGFLRKAGVAYDPRNLECGLWMGSLREAASFGRGIRRCRWRSTAGYNLWFPPGTWASVWGQPFNIPSGPPTEPLFYSRLSRASLIGRLST
jgi:hypothetical protein